MPGVQEDPRVAAQPPQQLSRPSPPLPGPPSQGQPPEPGQNMPFWNLTVGNHLQGVLLLVLLLLVFWGLWRMALPAIGKAWGGSDGAVVAESRDETLDPVGGAPLTLAEVADLQVALTEAGYDPGPVDGIMGEMTRRAADEARGELGLEQESDRRLLEILTLTLEMAGPSQ